MDPELEMSESISAIKYIDSLIKTLEEAKNYSLLDKNEIKSWLEALKSKRCALNDRLHSVAVEVARMAEASVGICRFDY